MKTAAVILAAGSSTRMGQAKQLLPIDGEPLLLKVIRAASEAKLSPVVVVLGSNAESLKEFLPHGVVSCENSTWQKGMGSSIKKGIAKINSDQSIEAALVLVADQPKVTVPHLEKLSVELEKSNRPIVSSFYANAPGVPVLFKRSEFESLLQIEDAYGAKQFLLTHKERVHLVDFPDGSIDLDTPEDYQNYIQSRN
jgi:molybdenum cofactor cytidylyltransferase